VLLPPAGYETFQPEPFRARQQPFRRTIATMPASEARRWH
jgi:hypothetical protein